MSLALAGALSAMMPMVSAYAQQTISGASGSINWTASDLFIDNTAVIGSVGIGVQSGASSLGTLINQGFINASTIGVSNTVGNTIALISNDAGGTISGGTVGSAILNSGHIDTLSNAGNGRITGGQYGVNNVTIGSIDLLSNAGTISGRTAVYNAGTIGSISNTGTFSGGANSGIANNTGGQIGTITNSGVMSGATGLYNNGTISSVTNSGTISGANVGVYSASAGKIGSIGNSGTISGNNGISQLSGGTISSLNNSGLITGTSAVGINNAGVISTLSNSAGGSIVGSIVGISNSSTISSLNNSGLIDGTNTGGITNSGVISSLSNSAGGSIVGSGGGIFNFGTISSLTNNGAILGTGGSASGISNNGSIGTLVNNGLISGGQAALTMGASSSLASFTNTGTLAGNIFNTSSHALTILGGSGTIFGTLTGYAGAIGSIVSSSTNLTFGSGNQLLNDNISVNAGNGTVTNSGTLQVNNPVTITGNYAQDAGATLLVGVTSGATFSTGLTDTGYGRLVVNGNAVIASGSAITLKSVGYALAQGQRYVVVAANGGGTNYNAGSLLYSATGYAVTGSVQADSGNASYSDLVLTLGAANGSGNSGSGSTSPNNNATTSNASSALGGLFKYSGTDAALLAVFNPAAALGSTASANKAGAQLSPAAVTGAAIKAVDAATQAVNNVVASHLDGFRLAQAGGSGIATGERSADIGVWGQVFGGRATQGQRDNVSGYHANYRGLLLGADGLVSDSVRVGGLFSAAKTAVASDGDNTGSSADVNSYGLTAYGTYTGSPWYVNVMAGAMRQEYSTVRSISYTGFSGVANGSFRGSQYLTSVQAGYPLNLDAWLPGATLTPIAGLSYSTLRQNGYTETGGSGAALSVKSATSNSLKSELGAKLERAFEVSSGKLLPSVQLGWRHEYKDKATQTGASFVADSTGSTAFVTQSATPVANVGVLNLGVTLVKTNNLSLTGKYTLESGGGYTAQTGSVQVRWQY